MIINQKFRVASAEFIGSMALLMIIIGSGIMGQNMAQGNLAIALLANSLTTGAGLCVLIQLFAPVSGAHFNPLVSLYAAWRRELNYLSLFIYIGAQLSGACVGVWLTHAMFALPILQASQHLRSSNTLYLSEVIATAGLFMVIQGGKRHATTQLPYLIAAYIVAGYWFTASTCFANPAVTFARAWSDTFAGIAPSSVVGFISAQAMGAGIGITLSKVLWGK